MVAEIELIRTSAACPEQYDAMYDGDCIGYLRLRWGHFTVEYIPGGEWELVYEETWPNDNLKGCFDDEVERNRSLFFAVQALRERHAGVQGIEIVTEEQ